MNDPHPPAAALISAHNLTLAFGSHVVFEDLSFSVLEGDLLGLVGPNGSGKTTLLRAILGTLAPRHGEILHHRSDIEFGYVPQRQHLDPVWPLRTLDVVAMGTYRKAGPCRKLAPEHVDAALQALEHVGIRALAERLYSELSGGQRQRALVARALAARANLMILDEPTQGMDLASTTGILALIEQLHAEGVTIVFSSHQLNTVANHVKRVALVQDGNFQIGPKGELLTAANLSALYGIPVEVARADGDRLLVISG